MNATVSSPWGIALTSGGDIVFAEQTGSCVRRIFKNGTITTIVGTGTAGSTGDGGPSTLATLNSPSSVSFSAHGDMYVAEAGNKIRIIFTNNSIATFAGNGVSAFAGDGGPATSASLVNSYGVAANSPTGEVYISGGARVRQVSTNGTITTIAGTGLFYVWWRWLCSNRPVFIYQLVCFLTQASSLLPIWKIFELEKCFPMA